MPAPYEKVLKRKVPLYSKLDVYNVTPLKKVVHTRLVQIYMVFSVENPV